MELNICVDIWAPCPLDGPWPVVHPLMMWPSRRCQKHSAAADRKRPWQAQGSIFISCSLLSQLSFRVLPSIILQMYLHKWKTHPWSRQPGNSWELHWSPPFQSLSWVTEDGWWVPAPVRASAGECVQRRGRVSVHRTLMSGWNSNEVSKQTLHCSYVFRQLWVTRGSNTSSALHSLERNSFPLLCHLNSPGSSPPGREQGFLQTPPMAFICLLLYLILETLRSRRALAADTGLSLPIN